MNTTHSTITPSLFAKKANIKIYKKEDRYFIGFGKDNRQKLGFDDFYWYVTNEKDMEEVNYTFEQCEWDKIKVGQIGFCANLKNIIDGENTFDNQRGYLDYYSIKCDTDDLAHIIDKDFLNSVSHCKKWIGNFCYYQLKTF